MMLTARLLTMPLLGDATLNNTVIVPQMEGVTTAIVAFIFVCVVYPKLVKNRTQFYAAFTAIVLVILLHSLNVIFGSSGFQIFTGATSGLLQVAAILLLFLACGGITLKELTGDMARAYEVIRRGEEEKTVIIPLTGEQPKPRQQPAAPTPSDAPGVPIDLPPTGGWPKKSDNSSLPLE
jgi:hypothetical protein